ncbi:Pao retrotransposon peptidase family protein [Aphelenchoides avenae]|nr:Pao retrotransposon peptidase family protein [Aphelenchus avenae]
MFPELQRITGQTTIPVTSWCDNQGVLYWIRNSGQIYGTFVQNRLTEIRKHANEGVQFLFVGTKDNPSDLASRGCTPDELQNSLLWWEGPKWLLKKEDWPAQPAEEGFQPFAEDELGPDSVAPRQEKTMVNAVSRDLVIGQSIPDLYGLVTEQIPLAKRTFARVKRVTAWVIRIARAILLRAKNRAPKHPLVRAFEADATKWSRSIQLHEYHLAEKMLLWSAQQSAPPTETHVQQFGLKEDPQGLLRLHDRLRNADLPEKTKFALWLPPRTKFSTEIVRGIHLDNQHAPQETVLGLLRERFWLVDARRQISSILRKTCVGCRVIKGPAFEQKPFADFPEGRVKPCRPFAHIGVDFFGPFKRREGDRERHVTKGRRHRKRTETTEDPPDVKKLWGCIFTCMATRAVFLQTMEDQTAECFLMAFQTFASHHGLPSSVISDNAPTFLLTAQTLDEVWKICLGEPDVAQYFREAKVEWRTITPYAPWQGGFYERLIQNVKTCLKASIGQRIMRLSAYNLLFAQITQTLNHRPLTFHRNTPGFKPLRPVDFLRPLVGHQADLQPLEDLMDEAWIPRETSAHKLIKTWQLLEARHTDFWKRWRSEYLLSLRAKARTVTNSGVVTRAPRIGEYVFVEDMSNVPRPLWKCARIKELVPDKDGHVRNAWLVVPGGTEILRAIHKLYPLELGDPEDPSATHIAERVRASEPYVSTENPARPPTPPCGARRPRKSSLRTEQPLLRRNPMRQVRFKGLPASDQTLEGGDEDGVS